MSTLELLQLGLANVFQASNLIVVILGVVGGIFVGAMPGLTATMAVATLLPFTFRMPPEQGLLLLIGVYVGAIYGGSIIAILLKVPGTPASAATMIDGHELARNGRAGEALSVSAIASFTGGIISTIALMTISPFLARVGLAFSGPEYFALAVFGLSIIASISGGSIIKGLIAGLLGLIVALVGMDPVTGFPRFTFGRVELMGGLSIIPVLVGLFAISEILTTVEERAKRNLPKAVVEVRQRFVSFKEFVRLLPIMIRSGLIGTFIGSVPGAGADIGAFVAYNEARRFSKHPEKFGKGAIEGVAAPEAGNNGVTGGAFVPMLTFGIPGDAVTAILLGGLVIHGLYPGPLLFRDHGDIVYTVFVGLGVANLVMLLTGLAAVRVFVHVTKVPTAILVPVIASLSIVGAYGMNNSVFDIGVAIAFGVVGYIMKKLDIPLSPLVLAIILGPMAESNLRRALLLHGDFSFMWTRPITTVFLVLALLSLVGGILQGRKIRKLAS